MNDKNVKLFLREALAKKACAALSSAGYNNERNNTFLAIMQSMNFNMFMHLLQSAGLSSFSNVTLSTIL